MFDHPPFLAITTGITFVNFFSIITLKNVWLKFLFILFLIDNKGLYRGFLERERVLCVKVFYLTKTEFLLMWNVIINNSNKCESPAQSPDLNTIKMFLVDLKAFVRSKYIRSTTYELQINVVELLAVNVVELLAVKSVKL